MQKHPCALAFLIGLFVLASSTPGFGATSAEPAGEREVIIVRPKQKPLSGWDEMMAHKQEYLRLKEKFEPTPHVSRIDLDTCERAALMPPGLRPPQIVMDMRGCP